MSVLTRFDVDPGGCRNIFSYSEDEERTAVFDIGWFTVMGGEVRQYEFVNRDGGRMSVVVLVRKNRYEGEDLEIWLWEWSEQEWSTERGFCWPTARCASR